MKDRFNVENESFDQSRKLLDTDTSVNLPMLFYYNKRINKGWINIVNIFRGTMVIGTPGSGKTFSVIVPFVKQLIYKGFTMLIYDYKYPDLTKLAYYHYYINKKKNPLMKFHVINLSKVEYSRRVNPLKPSYIKTLADASETAETLVQSLQKSDKQKGADQFFTQSAINFLSAVIYFFAKYKDGKYSTFPHILNFISQDYEDIFDTLYSNNELEELLSIFKASYENKSFGQLDGQIGTLRTNISRLASKEIAWIFTGDDLDLKISDPKNPSIIIIANEEETQSINSASNALILNRITKLINTSGNLPSAIVIDESPTIYIHKIEKLISTARSRKVAVLIGLQELPQLVAGYGRETSDTITSVIGNVLSGAVRKKETLNWLQQIFGKVKQKRTGLSIDRSKTSVSLSEQMDFLIPESKISNLHEGELVAQIAGKNDKYDGQHVSGSYNCKVNLDLKAIKEEEKRYIDPPKYYNFKSEEEKENILRNNYDKVKHDVKMVVMDNSGN
jgi:type IV secretory pathway TraG/TraD family ATPase VirD4